MEHSSHSHETPIFWVVTAVALVTTVVIIAVFIWFVYIGHEPLEPVHDENPHAAATSIFRQPSFLKV
ncbi:MAG: hypothetical protein IPN69_23540 [Acidobacteria bacterium]|nr:hypothetical protein [Acidobacteriota bacterium]